MSLRGIVNRSKSNRGGAGRYRPRLRLTTDPVKVRLLPGVYRHPTGEELEVGFQVMHYSPKIQQSFVCSSKWTSYDSKDGRCLGCYAYDAKQLSNPGPELEPYARLNMTMSQKYPVTVFVMEDFHLDPRDYKGNDMGYDKEGKHKYRKVLCTHNDECEGCRKGYKTEWGRRLIWELPPTYLEVLMTTIDAYQDYCACGTRGLEPEDALCPNCGHPLQSRNDTFCPSCQTKFDAPLITYHCQNPECRDPRPPTIFDADFTIKTVKADGFQTLTIARTDIGPISSRIPEDMRKPLELEKYYQPLSLGAQAMMLKVPNPFLKDSTFSYEDDQESDPKVPF